MYKRSSEPLEEKETTHSALNVLHESLNSFHLWVALHFAEPGTLRARCLQQLALLLGALDRMTWEASLNL